MANNINIANVPNKFNYTGAGYLDHKQGMIFEDVETANKTLSRTEKFQGLTIIVKRDESGEGPFEYWIPGTDRKFVKKGTTGTATVTAGEGIEVNGAGKVSVDQEWLGKEIDKKTTTLADRIAQISGDVTKHETRITSLEDQITKISGGKPEVDNKTIEYVTTEVPSETGPKQVEQLAVKVAPSTENEPNFLKSREDGLFSTIPIDGNDWGEEVGGRIF